MCKAKITEGRGAPHLRAIVILPQSGVAQEVSFLVDTGADVTSVGVVTSIAMGIHPAVADFDEVEMSQRTTTGAGGDTESFTIHEPVLLAFEEYDEERDLWSLHLEHKSELGILPNVPMDLLGRDIINRFTMDYNPGEGHAEMVRDNFANGGPYHCFTYDEQPTEQMELGNQNG